MAGSIDTILETIERLHVEIMDALIHADASTVERLVAKQAIMIGDIPKGPLSDIHRDRVRQITVLMNQQQLLIDQASQMVGAILKQIYTGSTFSQRV